MSNPISFIESCTKDFYLEDKRLKSKFSQDTYKIMTCMNESLASDINLIRSSINKKITIFAFDHHRKSILHSFSTYSEIASQMGDVAKFFKSDAVKNIDPGYTVYDLDYCVVDAIRPKFLSEFAQNIRSIVMNGKDGPVSGYLRGSLDRLEVLDAVPKVKANCVKVLKDVDLNNISELFGEYQKQRPVDDKYIKKMSSYLDDEKSRLQNVSKIIEDAKRALSEAEIIITDLTPVLIEGKYGTEVIDEKIRKFAYTGIRAISEVSSYMVYGIITLLTTYTNRLLSIMRVRDKIVSKISKTEELMIESTNNLGTVSSVDTEKLADDLKNGRADAYIDIGRQLYEYNKSLVDHILAQKEIDTEDIISKGEYSLKPYEDAAKIYIMIRNGLDIISKRSGEYIDVFDKLLEEAGFQLRLEDKYRGILDTLDDIVEYKSSSELAGDGTTNIPLYFTLINELGDYPENMDKLADTIFDVYQVFKGVRKRFDDNINTEYKSTEAVNQLRIFFTDFEEQFKIITNIIASKFLVRLRSLGQCADDFSKSLGEEKEPVIVTTEDTYDFTSTIFESEIDQLDIMDASISRYMQEAYISERLRRDRNCEEIIFEAEQPATNTGNNNQQGSNNGGTPSSQAKVIDNSTDANNAQKVSNKASKFAQGTMQKILESIKNWFSNTRISFKNLLDRKYLKEGFITGPDGKKLTYTNFLKTYKEYLLGKNYTNTEIHILPYTRIDDIYKGIESLKTNITALQKDNVKTIKSEQEMYQKLFTFVPGLKVGDVNAMKTQITNYMTTGREKPEDKIYKNNEVSDWVKKTIPFLEQFTSTHMGRINQEISAIETTLENVTKTYTEAFETIFADIDQWYMEADNVQQTTTGTNTNANTNDVSGSQQHVQSVTSNGAQSNNNEDAVGIQARSSWMRSAVMYFTGTVLNIIRDRVQNSFKILAGFSDKANKALAQKQQESNTENNSDASGNNNGGNTTK